MRPWCSYLPLGIDFVRDPHVRAEAGSVLAICGAGADGIVSSAAAAQSGLERRGGGGLERFVSPRRLRRVKASVSRGAFVVAGLAARPAAHSRSRR